MSATVRSMTHEELLTEYLKTKDQGLFTLIYERMRHALYSLALRLLESPADAEDVVQDVFCKLLEVEPEEIRSAESFLFRMVWTRAIDHQRHENGGIRDGLRSLDVAMAQYHAPTTDAMSKVYNSPDMLDEPIDHKAKSGLDRMEDEEDRLARQKLWEEVETVVGELPEDQQRTIDAYYARDLGLDEIAALFNLPKETVRSRLRRGMATLPRNLRQRTPA